MSSDRLCSQPTVTVTVTITTGQATMMALIGFCLLLFVALVLYLRVKHHRSAAGDTLVSAPDRTATRSCPPLDPSVLKSLPITTFRIEDIKLEGGKDCAVCLSDFADGEEARILPKCGHGFHVECIDMWFVSNSTCPLCRLPVDLTDSETCVVNINEGSSSAACSSS